VLRPSLRHVGQRDTARSVIRAVSGLPLRHGHNPIYKTRLEEGDGAMGLEDGAFQRVEGRRFFPWALLKKSRNDPDQNLFLRSDIF
jgi:hypothetical protein